MRQQSKKNETEVAPLINMECAYYCQDITMQVSVNTANEGNN